MRTPEFARFLEPDDPIIIGKDWRNEDVYVGEEYIETEHGAVQIDELQEYVTAKKLIKIASLEEPL